MSNILHKYKNMKKTNFIKKDWPKNSAEQKLKEFLIACDSFNKLGKKIVSKSECDFGGKYGCTCGVCIKERESE